MFGGDGAKSELAGTLTHQQRQRLTFSNICERRRGYYISLNGKTMAVVTVTK